MTKKKQIYSQSQSIFDEVKKTENILINIHRNPDLDSVGSATAMYQTLKKMGKNVTLTCPHKIPDNFKFLKGVDMVKTADYKKMEGDLFLILDSGSYDIVTGDKEILLPDIKKIIIDHHLTNNWKNYVCSLVDTKASATAEIVYGILKDWGVEIDQNISTSLLSGIAGDTVFFKYPKNPEKTFSDVTELIKSGGSYNLLIEKFNDSLSFGFVKLLGEFLKNMREEKNFVWSAVDYLTYEKFGKPRGARETAANGFFRSVEDINFGVAIVEDEPGKLSMSFRSKGDFDVSKLAEKFGGGGHKNAAGANAKGEFEKTIKEIINTLSCQASSNLGG